jgi:hypothetical protein
MVLPDVRKRSGGAEEDVEAMMARMGRLIIGWALGTALGMLAVYTVHLILRMLARWVAAWRV